jgi:hypothetical protein
MKKQFFGKFLLWWVSAFLSLSAVQGLLEGSLADLPYTMNATILFLVTGVSFWSRFKEQQQENRLEDRFRFLEKHFLEKQLAENSLSLKERAERVFQNLEAIVNFLNGYPEEIKVEAIGLGHNVIYVILPSVMLQFVENNETFMAENSPNGDCRTHTVLSNNMLLSTLCQMLDKQEQFARALLGKLGPDDHFLLDIDDIQTPEGIVRDISSGGGVFAKGTLANFVRWIAENNLRENSKEEEVA